MLFAASSNDLLHAGGDGSSYAEVLYEGTVGVIFSLEVLIGHTGVQTTSFGCVSLLPCYTAGSALGSFISYQLC